MRSSRLCLVIGSAVILPALWTATPVGATASSTGFPSFKPVGTAVHPLNSQNTSPGQSARHALAQLPLIFEANRGQTDSRVRFLARSGGTTLFIATTGATIVLRKQVGKAARTGLHSLLIGPAIPHPQRIEQSIVRLTLPGGSRATRIVGLHQLPGKVNYFIGNDPHRWHTGIPTYTAVEFQNIYPHIDLLYQGGQGGIVYRWLFHRGANPGAIRLRFEGLGLRLDRTGAVLDPGFGTMVRSIGTAYHASAGYGDVVLTYERRFSTSAFGKEQRLAQSTGNGLIYSTLLGGSGEDVPNGVAVDKAGNAYVSGYTQSTNFPTKNAYQATTQGGQDAIVAKINPHVAGAASLIYSTYLGGNDFDTAASIALDSSDNVYVTGTTKSLNFPLRNAYQTTGRSNGAAFLTELSGGGSGNVTLVYSTYLGGMQGYAEGSGLAVIDANNVYVTGVTTATDFPTVNAYQPNYNSGSPVCGFVSKLNTSLSGKAALVYSTYLGSSNETRLSGITADALGNVYVGGMTFGRDYPTKNAVQSAYGGTGDGVVTEIDTEVSGSSGLKYSTYLGGNQQDEFISLALSPGGNVYVAGYTYSSNFPTKNAYQAVSHGVLTDVVAELNPRSSGMASLVFSTHLGGSAGEAALGIALDASGNAFIAGYTGSQDFPVYDAYQQNYGGGSLDATLSVLSADGKSLLYSTFLGGQGTDGARGIAVVGSGRAVLVGRTTGMNFPTLDAYQSTDAGGDDLFVSEIDTSALNITPLTLKKTADSNYVLRGSPDGYRITVNNGENSVAITLTSLTDYLPCGFTYTPGSTTGLSTTNPSISTSACTLPDNSSGQQQSLTWTGSWSVPSGGTTSLHFGVKLATVPGTYSNYVTGTASGDTVSPTGPTATISVYGPLTTSIRVDTATRKPGFADGYGITISNPTSYTVHITSMTDTLPCGFTYTTGSSGSSAPLTISTAACTLPNGSASQRQTLTWTDIWTTPAHGVWATYFRVHVAPSAGSYTNTATGTAQGVPVASSGPTASVTVSTGGSLPG